MTGYVVYDVFTDRPFGGNPLAVIPDAAGLPDDRLQAIAREFNFSETTFVYPPRAPDHDARVRIFTPAQEIPFAGHPVIGTAVALAARRGDGAMTFELGVGPVPVEVSDGAAAFTITRAPEVLHRPDRDFVAASLSLTPADMGGAPAMVSMGLPFVLAELADRAALSRARPVTDLFAEGARRYPCPLDYATLAWWRDGTTVHARMFAPLDNIPEDPATGSAAAALAAFLCDGAELSLTIRQGEDMGRPSLIGARARGTGEGADRAVAISGRAVKVMEGRLVV